MNNNVIARRNEIVRLIKLNGNVLVDGLSNLFVVSEATIRSDLRILENKGLLKRFHGGAIAQNSNNMEIGLEEKCQVSYNAKKLIAKKAVSLIQENSTIILDSGSTTFMIAQELLQYDKKLTVITNNVPASLILGENNNILTCVSGGTMRKGSKSLHGQIAEQAFNNVSADIMFVGADGINITSGITTFNDGYAISKVMMQKAKKIVVVLDSSKFGKSCYNLVIPISNIDIIITDSGLNAQYIAEFQTTNIEFMIV